MSKTETTAKAARHSLDAAIHAEWAGGKNWTDIAMERGICVDEVKRSLARMGEKIE